MSNKSKTLKTKIVLYSLPGLIVIAVLLAVYAVNGIYPFGQGGVAYDDMVQNTIPLLTAFRDVLHGNVSALFNWNTGTGVNIIHTVTEFLSPLSPIFFLICPRDMIADWMSYFVMLKLLLMSISMMFFIDKSFKIEPFWKVILSLLYPFSGYVLQLYTNIEWLDIAIFFPLLIVALKYLFEKGKILPYVLILALCAARTLYITFMVYLFLLLVGGLYIIMIVPKNTRKTSIYNFGLGSVFAILVAAVYAIPSYFYLTSSSRFASTNNYLSILSAANELDTTKIGMVIIAAALPIAICCLMLLKFREEKKKIGFCVLAFAALGLQVIFENINLIWHMGSYIYFPMRYAFMLSFVLLASSAFAIQRFGSRLFNGKGIADVFMMLFGLAFAGGAAYLFFSGKVYSQVMTTICKWNSYVDSLYFAIVFFVLLLLSYLLILKFGIKRTARVLICFVLIFEIGVYANRAFSATVVRARDYDMTFIDASTEIEENTSLKNDNLSRIKNSDCSLNSNYPLLLNHSSVSNFTHIIPSSLSSTMNMLGYSTAYTRILDVGGTLLTDALLNCKNTLTTKTLDEDAYSLLERIGNYNIYTDNFTLPFGLVVDDSILDKSFFEGNAFEINNKIYRQLSGDSEDIFEIMTEPDLSIDYSVSFTVNVEGTKRLYCSDKATGYYSVSIFVNGEMIEIPTLGDSENTDYIALFNNNIIDLGTFTDETVTVTFLSLSDNADYSSAMVGIMDMDKLSSLCESYENYDSGAVAKGTSLTLDVDAEKDGKYLFLPVVYYDTWSCTVNGVVTAPVTAMGSFMAVKLNKGENRISMKFTPKGLKEGAIISVVSIAALAVLLLKRKKKPLDPESTNLLFRLLEKGYIAAIAGLFAVLYILPIICSLFIR